MKKKKHTSRNIVDTIIPPTASSNVSEISHEQALGFPIVGIGASAGGLAAFEAFFSGMPANTDPGMAFVLVQHLDPDHKSILTELIRKYTRMQVFEAEDGMIVKPNSAYIIPPGYDMAFFNGSLQLLEPALPRGRRLPIDFFFRSLAQDQRERSIGIVLSGTGSDGTMGARAIKGEGGLVIAQTPASTEYDGMPCSAIAAGLADYELSPTEMPAQLISFVAHTFGKTLHTEAVPTPKTENALKKIFVLLRDHTGHDFSQYKPSTLQRRIERRMAVQQIDSIESYIILLQKTKNEVETLFRDLLIGVTNFFRDPETFTELEKTVIPTLFKEKKANDGIRVWSTGCSTGEEAYSIAILLYEQMEERKQNYSIQIFATDIDKNAITAARAGIYPSSITADLTPESYRINKNIRDMLIFSEHNVIKDPPFSKLDFISCRNLMIYMSSDLQKKVIPMFHYALNPNGILLLGTSETVGEYSDLFATLDRKSKIYQRKDNSFSVKHRTMGDFLPPLISAHSVRVQQLVPKPISEKISLRELAEKTLLQYLAPASALVNKNGDIFYLHGRTGMFLEPATGEVGIYNILKMAREGLRHDLTTALHKASETNDIIRYDGLRVKTNGHYTPVNLRVCPVLKDAKTSNEPSFFLVVMEEGQPTKESDFLTTNKPQTNSDLSISGIDHDRIIATLKHDLQAKEEYLQTANEELETSNEELKSSNEEMQSINEELQSTNEELETSKEELQSVNEELATVNAELQTKVADLTHANNDMNNLLAGTGIATIFVDHQLRILRFTPTVSLIINLINSDVGRPVGHIVSNLVGYTCMLEDTQSVLQTLIPKEIEVQITNGKWYVMRIQPYRTTENVIEGAVITFVEITEIKLAIGKIGNLLEEKNLILQEAHHRVRNLLNTISLLLSLQAVNSKKDETITALNEAGNRVRSMMLLYNKIYNSPDIKDISISEYLPELADKIVSNFPYSNSIRIEYNIQQIVICSRKVQPLGIIVNELLTNIMKYAFKDRNNGLITISVSLNNTCVTLIITDDGNGMPESVTFEDSPGFGLFLINSLVKQLEGTIQIERENGTRIIIDFEK